MAYRGTGGVRWRGVIDPTPQATDQDVDRCTHPPTLNRFFFRFLSFVQVAQIFLCKFYLIKNAAVIYNLSILKRGRRRW